MDEKRKKIRTEIIKLVDEGSKILEAEDNDIRGVKQDEESPKVQPVQVTYQKWYTKTLPVIEQLLPERLSEFINQYKNEKRKEIDFLTYTISDYLIGLQVTRNRGLENVVDTYSAFHTKFNMQIAILYSCLSRLDSILADIKGTLQADLFDDELSAAEDLLKKGHIRAAGALAGVTLERHLGTVAENHEIKIAKKNPTIADFNEALKTAEVYDVPDWRFIQRLGDIRNLAVHNKDREPTKDEIDDLIKGTQKIIKTIF